MNESLPLKDLLEYTRDGEWGQAEPGNDLEEMAVIRGTDFLSLRRGDTSTVPRRFIPRKAAARKTLIPGDILIETAGGTKDQATGRTVYLTERLFEEFTVPVTCASFSRFLRVNRGLVNPRYLFWHLQSSYSTGEMLPYHIQHTGVARFQYTNFASEFQVILPPLEEQDSIANTLSMLDDKIEVNRRMNETLEAMARAIFKDWFADFGPTRAKAAGRAPYLAPEIWDLFPHTLDEEGKPAGWGKGILADIAASPRRGVSPADVAEDTPYIGLEHMPRRSIALTEWEGAGKVRSNKSVFRKGEFLFGKLRPYFHKVGLTPLDGICSTDIVVVVPRDPDWAAFTLACLSSDEFVDYTDQTSTGTKMPRTSWKTMGQYRICRPSRQVVHAFQSLAHPLFEIVSKNIHESRTLARTRDLLLPKLMCGEIRLADADKEVEAVA